MNQPISSSTKNFVLFFLGAVSTAAVGDDHDKDDYQDDDSSDDHHYLKGGDHFADQGGCLTCRLIIILIGII